MSVESRILRYLRENPRATPRLIADALGLPLNQVRLALNRLRDSGQVVRVPGEGYYARVSTNSGSTEEVEAVSDSGLGRRRGDEASHNLEKLRETVDHLVGRLDKLEKEVKEIKVTLEALTRTNLEFRVRPTTGQDLREDSVIRELRSKKVMKVGEVLTSAPRPLDEYVKAGLLKIVADLAVDQDFYNKFLSKFPIRKLEVTRLSNEEKELMNAMIREGIVYLHCGREYRLTSPQI